MNINATTTSGFTTEELSGKIIKATEMLNHTHELPTNFGVQSMPDYANMVQFGSRVYKINVPGYIFVHFSLFSNIDYALLCSSDPGFLQFIDYSYSTSKNPNIQYYYTYNPWHTFKLSEGFGAVNRNQSSTFIPIVPGKYTYIRPIADISRTPFQYYNMHWFFIPTVAMHENFSSCSGKFIVDYTGADLTLWCTINWALSGHIYNRATIFDGANDPDTWKQNIGYSTNS